MRILFVATCLLLSSFVNTAIGYPKATDEAARWQFDFATGDLRFYRDSETSEGYWLLLYEVTNNTNVDRQWTPSFDLVTDRGEIIEDGEGVARQVQIDLLERFGDELLQLQSNASGPILQGEENAIRGLIIWKAGQEEVKEVQVFVSGASGDTADVIHPLTGETHKLHRVLQLSWFVHGDLDDVTMKPLLRRPVTGGTSVRRLTTEDRDAIGGLEVSRKWIFR